MSPGCDTRTGGVLEAMILPALEQRRYKWTADSSGSSLRVVPFGGCRPLFVLKNRSSKQDVEVKASCLHCGIWL